MAAQTLQKQVTKKSRHVFPLILKPVLSLVLKASSEKGANIGVHKHSPVRENTSFFLKDY